MSTAALPGVTGRQTGTGLNVSGLSAGYGPTTRVIHDVDLNVPAGRLTAVLGASGCGKTTLLRAIAGFLRPDQGTIAVGNRVLAANGVWVPPEKRRIGIVPQEGALFAHLDVAGNIGFGVPRKERAERVAELLDIIGMSGLEKTKPHQLSGGMQQRVALARALAPTPAVVLLDEPFSALDVALRASVRSEVLDVLRATGTTGVLVTHDQDEALSSADDVALIREGRIVQVAEPQEIYRHPANRWVAEFLGDCNFLPAHRQSDGSLRCAMGTLPPTVPFDSETAVAMLRPEHVAATRHADGAALVTDVSFHGHDVLLSVQLPQGPQVKSRMLAAVTGTPTVGDTVELQILGV